VSVAYDNTAFISSSSASTLTTPSFTIAGTNRAAFLGLSVGSGATSITGACGGVSGAAISGADSGAAQSIRSVGFGVTAPASGSQTGTMSWTLAAGFCVLGVVTAQGVDQTTPLNGGATSNGASGNPSRSIASAAGDLTVETTGVATGTLSSPTQTQRWNDTVSNVGAGSTGPGTANPTHGWTSTGGEWSMAGANFVAAAEPGANAPTERSRGFNLEQMADAEDEGRFNELDVRNWF